MIVNILIEKRKRKKLFSGAIALILLISVLLPSAAFDGAFNIKSKAINYYESGYYTYTVTNEYAAITDVDSDISGKVTTPKTLGGYPVTGINNYAFSWCNNITSVVVSEGIKAIGEGAFYGCGSMTSATIPDSTTKISEYAFHDCDELAQVTIGKSVSNIEDYAFSGCKKLAAFIVSPQNPYIDFTTGALIIGSRLVCYPCAKSDTSYYVPSSVTTICPNAFSNAVKLTSVNIPNTVTKLTYYSFQNCTNLVTVSLPSSVKSIEESAFENCGSLKNINLANVSKIGSSAFEDCIKLPNVTLSTSLTTIPSYAFYGCKAMTSVNIPSSVKTIDIYAFRNCTALSSITLPDSIESINRYAFEDTAYYNNSANWVNGLLYKNKYLLSGENASGDVTVKSGTGIIADYAFSCNDKITAVTISDTTTNIGASAFFSCNKLKKVSIGDNVTKIGDYAFCSCESLTDIVFGKNVSVFGEHAFAYCTGLVEVNVPEKVTEITYGAFCDCDSLRKVSLPAGIKRIGSYAFQGCSQLNKPKLTDGKFSREVGIYSMGNLSTVNVGEPNNVYLSAYKTLACSRKAYEKDEGNTTKGLFGGKGGNSKGSFLPNHILPGIYDNMIPQGLAYYKAKDWFLVSAYHNPKEGNKKPCVIYAIEASTGKFVAQFNLYNVGGTVCTAHVGGVAVSDNNVYVTYYDNQIAYAPLSEFNVPNDSVKDIKLKGCCNIKPLAEGSSQNKDDKPANTAFVEVCNDVLWTGNFNEDNVPSLIFGSDSYKYKASKKYNSIIVGYKLNSGNSDAEWASVAAASKETYRINLDNVVDGIQGATIFNNRLYLSRTRQDSFGAEVWVANANCSKGNTIYLKKNDFQSYKNIDGAEEITIVDGKLYCVYESGALEIRGDTGWSTILKSVTGAMYAVNLGDLSPSYLSVFHCPIDIEITDKDTNQVVCRIVDNVIDETVQQNGYALVAGVNGDEKYVFIPKDGNYSIKITGNGTGTMDYSLINTDSDFNEIERANFFNVPISHGTTLNCSADAAGSGFRISDCKLTGDSTILPTEYFTNRSVTYNVNISSSIGGTVTDSLTVVSGDDITVTAVPDAGYAFNGWYDGDKLVSMDADLNYVIKEDTNLIAKFIRPELSISQPSTLAINFSDTLILHTETADLPEGAKIVWEVSGDFVKIAPSEDGTTCAVTSVASGTATVTAKIVDADDNPICDNQGEEISASLQIKSNAGFFQKLIAFFKKLFGLTKTIPQLLINP